MDSEIDDYYFATIMTNVGDFYPHFYYRNNDVDTSVGLKRCWSINFFLAPNSQSPDSLNYNAVVKGIPLST